MPHFITIHDANAGARVAEKTVNVDYIILAEDSTRAERYGRLYVKDVGPAEDHRWTTRVIDTQETYRQLRDMIRDKIGTKNAESGTSNPQ